MRQPIRAVFILFLLLIVGSHPLAQDEEPEYPHGDFDGDCTQCHGDEGWTPTVIAPGFRTGTHPFPLRQAHDVQNCRACHSTTLDFTKADPACVSCHMDVHSGEFGTDCSRCHVPRTFIDRLRMQRLHHLTRFPLRGSHRAIDCESCHPPVASGSLQYVGTPVDCEACHLNDYLGSSDPNHTAAGFPTNCEACHAPGLWEQGRFDHDSIFFPIFSGEHRNRWSGCSTCHIVPNDFSQFSCFGCHPHDDEAGTTADHSGIAGFNYTSGACYACHPRGEAP